MSRNLTLFLSLRPTMPDFQRYALDRQVSGVLVDCTTLNSQELLQELRAGSTVGRSVPLYFNPQRPRGLVQIIASMFSGSAARRIKRVASFGSRHLLPRVESQCDIDNLRQHVGCNAQLVARIESRKGVDWVSNHYQPQPNVRLMTAPGDVYEGIDSPYDIPDILRLIIEKDPTAIAGSSILQSFCHRVVPDAADFSELASLNDMGYRTMVLSPELCRDPKRLTWAINAFDAFRHDYANKFNAVNHETIENR